MCVFICEVCKKGEDVYKLNIANCKISGAALHLQLILQAYIHVCTRVLIIDEAFKKKEKIF